MSSIFVRDSIIAFVAAELSSEVLIDLTAEFSDLAVIIKKQNLGPQDKWLGIQFVGSDEIPIDVKATNNQGNYRETGIIYFHIVDVAKLGVHNPILVRAEALRNAFRGMRIEDTILIESVSPPNFGDGITLNFEGGYTSCLVSLEYQRDFEI